MDLNFHRPVTEITTIAVATTAYKSHLPAENSLRKRPRNPEFYFPVFILFCFRRRKCLENVGYDFVANISSTRQQEEDDLMTGSVQYVAARHQPTRYGTRDGSRQSQRDPPKGGHSNGGDGRGEDEGRGELSQKSPSLTSSDCVGHVLTPSDPLFIFLPPPSFCLSLPHGLFLLPLGCPLSVSYKQLFFKR